MIEFRQVSRLYPRNHAALSDVTLSIARGEWIYLSGPSGAGKSTLLKMIAGIERPTSGVVAVNGQDLARLKTSGLPYLRRKLGLMFQQQTLLNDRSVLDNVVLPLLVTGAPRADAERRARAALDKVGLLDQAASMPLELSGGEQQRVAVARAIVNRPQIILADEPTANLDRASASKVMEALRAFHGVGVTCLVATHDEVLLQDGGRIVYLERGRVVNADAPAGQVVQATGGAQ
jgi:cell division transport system ATP-binding protein